MEIKSIFLKPTNNVFLQLVRYTFVGGVAFLVDFVLLFVLTEYCHLYYLYSATLSFLAGLVVNYLLSKVWVFSRQKIKNSVIEFFIFSLIGVIGLGFNNFFLWLFTEHGNINYLLSKVFTTIIVYFWNFFARKYILFNT